MTLQELFEEYSTLKNLTISFDNYNENRLLEIIKEVESREEKAIEEGRKEGFKLGVEDRDEYWKNYPIEEARYEAITQYKEELIEKIRVLEKETLAYIELANEDGDRGRLEGISEIKKLL